MSTNSGNADELLAVTTQAIVTKLGVAPSTLDYWVAKGLCGPSLASGRGQRFQRFWSIGDVVIVRVVQQLRQSGVSLQRVVQIRDELLQKWNAGLAESVLLWDGHDLLNVDGAGDVMKVLEQSGQLAIGEVLQIVSLPFGTWLAETSAWPEVIPFDRDLESKREERIERLQRKYENSPTARVIQTYREQGGLR